MEPTSIKVYESTEFNPLDFVEEFIPSIEESDRPILFYDLSEIIRKVNYWKEQMPRIQPFYAVKSNNNPIVLKLMAKLGTGFDCASKEEIENVINIGVDPKTRIVYANTVKITSHLIYAREQNAELMTFDRESELEKIKKYYPCAKLLLRIATVPENVSNYSGEKFGCEPNVEGPRLLEVAKKLKLNIVGIAFHIGHEPLPKEYVRAIKKSATLFKIGKEMGFDMKILDIGGGFLADHLSLLNPYADAINPALETYFKSPEISVISEPGSYLSNSAGTLFTTIQSKRSIIENNEKKIDYFIDDGIFNSMRFWIDIYPNIKLEGIRRSSGKKTETFSSTIYGPTCYSGDVIAKNIQMEEFEVGDLIRFPNIGAYSLSMSSEFNGIKKPFVKYFVQKHDLDKDQSIL